VSLEAVKPAGAFSAWERSIAVRYLRAKKKQGGVALVSIISFIGVMLAVAVLISVMSIMNGFRSELISKIVGYILQWSGSYVPIFFMAASAYLAAWVVFQLLAPKLEPAHLEEV